MEDVRIELNGLRELMERDRELILGLANMMLQNQMFNAEQANVLQRIIAEMPEVRVQPVRNVDARLSPGAWRLPTCRPRKYDEATRNQAIQSVREGVPYSKIARDIGRHCNSSTISKWVYQARAQGLLPPGPTRRRRNGAVINADAALE